MKKTICLLLAVVLLSLCACGSKQETPEPTQPEKPALSIPRPITWEDIDAIPIATADMTEDELRQICVDFFRLQQTAMWTPKVPFNYDITTYDKHPSIVPGTVYAGCPYVSPSNTGNLYRIMDFYDSQTGVLDNTQMEMQDFAWLIGNDCVSGPFWGWGRVVNSFLNYANGYLNQEHGCIPVGPYHYENISVWCEENNTKSVCDANGEQIMYESYAQVKPADGLYTQWNTAKNSHLRMAVQAATVVYAEDGSIDGRQSFLTYTDQGSSLEPYKLEGATALVQGDLDVKVTFKNLFDNGYLPFTWAELIGEDPVEPATVKTLTPLPKELTTSALYQMKFTTNYAISHYSLELRDSKGNVTFQRTMYAQRRLEYNAAIGGMVSFNEREALLETLKTDSMQATVTCRVSTGQLLTVYDGPLIP